LISVTNFFRDPEAYEQLARQVIAPLVQAKEAGDAIRVWVPGCATGEEPYSIAILLREQQAAAPKSCRLQIFATDVNEDALQVARQGVYPDSIAADVSPQRLAHFLTRADGPSYQVDRQLREAMVFVAHDLPSDPPFSKLDLISCSNLLIYLDPDVQKKILALFHYALKPGGFLFLGPSETTGRQADLFESLSPKWRIYRRTGPARAGQVVFPIAAGSGAAATRQRLAEAAEVRPRNFAEVTQRLLLEQFAPAAVLVNRHAEALCYPGPCGRYLEFPAGQPTHDVTRMARGGLPPRVRFCTPQTVDNSFS
jgi:two-component system CheB/CheR fusion protein